MDGRLTQEDVTFVRNTFDEFKSLDLKKMEAALTKVEEIRWGELHTDLISKLFNVDFTDLLDRRNYIRIPVRIKLLYKYKNKKYEDFTHDLSVSGACLPFNRELKPGFIIKIIFYIGYKKWFGIAQTKIKLDAMISWAKPSSNIMGVEFLTLSDKVKKHLANLVYWHLEQKIKDFENLVVVENLPQ